MNRSSLTQCRRSAYSDIGALYLWKTTFCSLVLGVSTARGRNLLSVSGTLETQTLSDRIEPEYRQTIGVLNDQQQLEQCWMVQDALSHDVLLFTPVGRVFVFSFNTKLKYSAWSEYSDMDYQCGCKTFLGRLFYALGVKSVPTWEPCVH